MTARARPYVVVLITLVVIALVPARHRVGPKQTDAVSVADSPPASGSTSPGETAAASPTATPLVASGTPTPSVDTASTVHAARTPTSAVTKAPARIAGAVAAVGGRPAAGQGAGIGSEAALAAADCDRARGRIKVPFAYAPPCAVPWPAGADNGGSTSAGVTATSIKVVIVYSSSGTTPVAAQQAHWQDFIDLYQHTYRLWGRSVNVEWVAQGSTDEAGQRADALKVADKKPFVALGVAGYPTLLQELAARGVIVADFSPAIKNTLAVPPFYWGVDVPNDAAALTNAGEYAGKRLLGRPARWSGQPDLQVAPRKFALLVPEAFDSSYFDKEFAKYGGAVVDKETFKQGYDAVPSYQERARTIVGRMKAAGTTTVINAGDVLVTPVVLANATQQQWFPEWFVAGAGGIDIDLFGRAFDQTQWQHAFGVSSWPVGGEKPPSDQYLFAWYWGNKSRQGYETGTSHFAQWLFTGLHGAGPHLTPQTFRDGLFSNRPSGGAAVGAVMSNQVSFGRWGLFPWDDYQAWDDFGEVYWDATAQGKDANLGVQGVGKYRFLNGGKRSLPGYWPAEEPKMFDATGTAMWFNDYPAADKPPDYACVSCPSTS